MSARRQRRPNLARLPRNKVMDGDQLAIRLDLASGTEDLGLLGADALRERSHVERRPFRHAATRLIVVPGDVDGLVVAYIVVGLEDAPAVLLARRYLLRRGFFCIVFF